MKAQTLQNRLTAKKSPPISPLAAQKPLLQNNSKTIVSVTALILAFVVTVVSIVGSTNAMKPEDLTVKAGREHRFRQHLGRRHERGRTFGTRMYFRLPRMRRLLERRVQRRSVQDKVRQGQKNTFTPLKPRTKEPFLLRAAEAILKRVTGRTDLATEKEVGCIGEIQP